ncbi:MAG TPA: putative glycoside hydrolase, partial [Candidatus Angelobacter sp.]
LDMHVIARQALFRDDNIAQRHSELAVQSRGLHQPWRENGKLVWSDSSNKQVQDYNIALAKYVAGSGVDEIQFDYVRFPAEGNQADAQFAFQKDPTTKIHRDDVIANFLDHAYTELHPMGVLVSLDVFGIMAWQRQVDLSHTGQDITKMAKHCDVISPMIYPSHFFGMDGYKAPGDAPEHFISVSMDRFEKVTAGTGVVLRPWLQAFRWRTKTYSPEYILKQVSTAKGHHGDGFLFWNAANDYSKPFAAMPTMMANPKTYLYTPPTAVAENNPAAINPEKTATSQGATHSRP